MLFDFFWGTELFPRVFGWDVKQFTNCRFGMMLWAVGIISFAWAQAERSSGLSDSMIVSVALQVSKVNTLYLYLYVYIYRLLLNYICESTNAPQLVYITKFFHWETGYLSRFVQIDY